MHLKYLAYTLLKTDFKKVNQLVNLLHQEKKTPKRLIYKDLVTHLFKWNTHFIDYFYNQFFDDAVDKTKYASVWDMYLFHKKYNRKERMIFRDKLLFKKRFSNYSAYPYFELNSEMDFSPLYTWIKDNNYQKIVAKKPLASSGKGVKILKLDFVSNKLLIDGRQFESYINTLYKMGFTLFESYIEQHSCLKQIYPGSINTIRIVTFVNGSKEVEVWGTTIRMGVNKSVDNFSMGGISANIDINSGIINTKARYKSPFQCEYDIHPVTGENITGVEIPYWAETIETIKKAALEVPEVRTIGWDIAITPQGPTLIEGNDNWNKTNFELVTGIGLNNRIKALLKQHEV